MKAADLIGAIFCGHSSDGMELGVKGWVEIDRIVAYLSLKIESHCYDHSFRRASGIVDG